MITTAILIPNIFLILLLTAVGLLIWKYHKRYYDEKKMSLAWKLIVLGLIVYPLLSKLSALILRLNPTSSFTVALYIFPLLAAMLLSFGALMLWRQHRL